MVETDVWLTRKEASDFLKSVGCPISTGYLDKMAADNNAGKGPPFVRSGWRTIRYLKADVAKWAELRKQRIA